jgi:Tol biopolymer transport system component
MTRKPFTDEMVDDLMMAWLDERAHGPEADPVIDAALARTSRTRPLPGWLVPERWIPAHLTRRFQPIPRLAPVLLLIGLLLLAVALAIVVVGSPHRLPPPFGLAAPGSVAFVADGHLWTTDRDGSNRVQLTSDPRIDGFPTFSRDGTRIAFRRLPTANSKPDWQEWGDVMVADADGGHPIVLDAMVHSPSPMTWSADGRFIVYSRTVGTVDQVFMATTDGSSTRQITSGAVTNWGPALSPDGRTIAFARGDPVVGIYVIQIDATGERRITMGAIGEFDTAEWSPDATTLLFGAGNRDQDREDLFLVGLDGKAERRIIESSGNDSGATWSPDGASIAYLNTPIGGKARVMVAAPDGSHPLQISDPGDWSYPYWSPDAQHVLAVDRRLGGGQSIVSILDPLGKSPASSFPLSGAPGDGPEPLGWQRRAP